MGNQKKVAGKMTNCNMCKRKEGFIGYYTRTTRVSLVDVSPHCILYRYALQIYGNLISKNIIFVTFFFWHVRR